MAADIAIDEVQAAARSLATEDRASLRWTVTVVVVMVVLLALFNAASMRSWADNLPPTSDNLAIRGVAERWSEATDRWGLSTPRARLRAGWEQARRWRFPSPQPTGTPSI